MPSRKLRDEDQSRIFLPASYVSTLDWSQVFHRDLPIEIEFGAGDGSFLARYAALHPDRNFLGIERLLGRLRKVNRKALGANLDNLKAFRIEIVYFLRYLIPANSVAAIHVYFPDPWPKKRHYKNRLINEGFVEMASRGLAPNGMVYLRTDNAPYFNQMEEVFSSGNDFERTKTPVELLEIKTDFEVDFNARGVKTLAAAYRKSG